MSTRAQLAVKIGAPLVLGSAALLGAMHRWEEQRLVVYADELAGGLPTYCSGRTQPPRPVSERLTQAQCDTIDQQTAAEYGRAVLACIPADKFDQNSFDAFTLFAINVGKQGACESRAARLLRDGNREAACRALARGPDGRPVWSFAGGVFVQGLQNRRQYEKNWCLTLAEVA